MLEEMFLTWPDDATPPFIRAGAVVNTDGSANLCCLSSSRPMSDEAQIHLYEKLEGLQFVPASRNGEVVQVFIGMTIFVHDETDESKVSLYLNRLESYQEFGFDYVAPQRQVRDRILPLGTGTVTRLPGYEIWRYPRKLWGVIETTVAADGTASDSTVTRLLEGQRSVLKRGAKKSER